MRKGKMSMRCRQFPCEQNGYSTQVIKLDVAYRAAAIQPVLSVV